MYLQAVNEMQVEKTIHCSVLGANGLRFCMAIFGKLMCEPLHPTQCGLVLGSE